MICTQRRQLHRWNIRVSQRGIAQWTWRNRRSDSVHLFVERSQCLFILAESLEMLLHCVHSHSRPVMLSRRACRRGQLARGKPVGQQEEVGSVVCEHLSKDEARLVHELCILIVRRTKGVLYVEGRSESTGCFVVKHKVELLQLSFMISHRILYHTRREGMRFHQRCSENLIWWPHGKSDRLGLVVWMVFPELAGFLER